MRLDVRVSRRSARIGAALLALAPALAIAACEEEGGQLCEPETAIFCRCPGGDPGQKVCSEAGDAFGLCEGCEERPDPGEGGSDPGEGGSNPGGAPLYRPCTDASECESNTCEFGYCTVTCDKVSDCEFPVAECVSFSGATVCMPACEAALDCDEFGAPESKCGFAAAVDNWGVTVCATWGPEHQLMPDDSDCSPLDHEDCNLGYPNQEKVCTEQGLCKTGCFSKADCPDGQDCSSGGSDLGECS